MNDIVLLSVKNDEERVGPLLDAMVEQSLNVWWEQISVGNEKISAIALKRIKSARCVIIVWSNASTEQEAKDFFHTAQFALDDGSAICVCIDDVELPSELSGCTLYDLRGWRNKPSNWRKFFGGNLFLREIVAAAKFKIAGKDPPPANAGRDMLVRQIITVLPAIAAIFYFATSFIGLWVDLEMSKGPSNKEQIAWEALEQNSCDGLRGFLTQFPDGHYALQTQARLDGRKTDIQRHWERLDRSLPIFVGSGDAKPTASKETAVDLVTKRAKSESEISCNGLAEAGQARMIQSGITTGEMNCENFGAGFACSYEGTAVCTLDEPRDVEIETCRAPKR